MAANCKVKEKAEQARTKGRSEVAAWAIEEQSSNIEDYISEDESYTCELGL